MEDVLRFALVNNERVEATPKLEGLCPGCSQPVIAKCGTRKIWHWAHRSERTCDKWWEPETEWHRAWKNNFPSEWQEFVHHDNQSGEKHIADVRTSDGLVLEFQHSHLKPQERDSRERFYRNMVWVVDGTRLKNDYPRFVKGTSDGCQTITKGLYLVAFPEECFPTNWLESQVPVFFDFRGDAENDPSELSREPLWCLIPGRTDRTAIVVALSRNDFVNKASGRQLLSTLLQACKTANAFVQHLKTQREQQQLAEAARYYHQRPAKAYRRPWQRPRTRRF